MTNMQPISLSEQADGLRNRGQTKQAIALYRKLFHIYDQTFIDFERAAGALQQIGVSYKIDNNTKRSLQALDRALRYAKRRKLAEIQGNILRDIGVTYEYVDKLDDAERYLQESAALLVKESDRGSYGITLAKLGLVATRQGRYKEAEDVLRKGLLIIRRYKHWFFESTALLHLGNLQIEMKQYDKARTSVRVALGILDQHKQQHIHTRRYAQVWGLLAHAQAQLGNLAQARELLLKSLTIILQPTWEATASAVVLRDIRAAETVALLATPSQKNQ